MVKGFWKQLKRPIWALAPMHDVTDTVFRRMIAQKEKPHVFFTEFVSVDGLMHEQSREKMIERYLRYTDEERPLVAQIWGINPDFFRETARMLVRMRFDGIDINMGCPEKSAVKHGACAALVNTPELAQEIVRVTKEGAGVLPVSVKIRLGYKENVIEEWMKYLLEAGPAVITVHGRLAKDMSRRPADWESIGRAVEIAKGSGTLVLGNGDVMSLVESEQKVREYGVDGVMFGRAVFKNHWLFSGRGIGDVSVEEKLSALVAHARLYEEIYGSSRGFYVLRKHFKAYTMGFHGSKDLRLQLMSARDASEVRRFLDSWRSLYTGL